MIDVSGVLVRRRWNTNAWVAQQVKKLPPGYARIKFLQDEVKRRVSLARRYPEWVEIWGLQVNSDAFLPLTRHPTPSDRLCAYLRALNQSMCNHIIPVDYSWELLHTPCGSILTIDVRDKGGSFDVVQ